MPKLRITPERSAFAELKRREAAQTNQRQHFLSSQKRPPMAALYARVSHEDSADSKETEDSLTCKSVDHQLALAKARFEYDLSQGKLPPGTVWANVGWVGRKQLGEATTDGCFVDQAVSAFTHKWRERPAGRRCDAFLKPGDSLYIAYLERGFRDWKDFAAMLSYWNEKGIRVVFVSPELDLSTWTGEMVAAVLSLCSWLQSTLMSAKFREQAERRRLAGMPRGRTNLGWKVKVVGSTRRVLPDDEVREMLLLMRQRFDGKGKKVREPDIRAFSQQLEEQAAQEQNRTPFPDWPHFGCENRRWTWKRLSHLWERRDKVPLPSRLLPPGTLDVPPPPQRKPRPGFGNVG